MATCSSMTSEDEGTATPATSKWVATKTKVSSVIFVWKISNISSRLETEQSISSSSFHTSQNQWKLVLRNKSGDEQCRQFLGLFLQLESRNSAFGSSSKATAMFKAWIVNSREQKSNIIEHIFEHLGVREVEYIGHNQFVKRDDIFNETKLLVSEDVLTVMCEVSVVEGDNVYPGDLQRTPQVAVTGTDVSKRNEPVLRDALFSDITLVVGDREFPAHRGILAAHSDVFRAMFESNMKESSERRVVIEDLSSETVEDLLQYIYTGVTPNIDKLATELLMAADKYNIESLKTVCEEQLSLNLELKNAVDLLILADRYRLYRLKKCALHWISRRIYVVMQTDAWTLMVQHHNDLVLDVLQKVAKFVHHLTFEQPQ